MLFKYKSKNDPFRSFGIFITQSFFFLRIINNEFHVVKDPLSYVDRETGTDGKSTE